MFLKNLINLYVDRKDYFIQLIGEHIFLSTVSIVLATIIGILLGILISQKNNFAPFVLGANNLIYTIPSIALFGFLISITGIGGMSAILALTVYALLPIVRNTYVALTTIDIGLIEASKGMGSSEFQILWKIKLPLSVPIIMAGFRNMVIMTIALCGIASFIGAGGLGSAIWRGITTNNTMLTISGAILISLLALITDMFLGIIEKYLKLRFAGVKIVERKIYKKLRIESLIALLIMGILVITSCTSQIANNENKRNNTIVIASKPMTEQYIISEIIAQLIEENTNLKVDRQFGIGGGTSNIQPGMVNGDFDIYPEYTGTAMEFVLKESSDKMSEDDMYKKIVEQYKEKYRIKWTGLLGFNDTYTFTISNKYKDINSMSDLSLNGSDLVFGAEPDFFERTDGFDAFSKFYNVKFKKTIEMDIGLKYDAIESGKVDIINGFSTDARLNNPDLKTLKDDKNFFPNYYAGILIREKIIELHPELENLLGKLNGSIDEKKMIDMNYNVEIKKESPENVAKEFLKENKLIK